MSEGSQQLANGVKLVGETILPGTSLLMDGNVKSGAAHAVTGLVARALVGPVGWGLIAANSFSKSVSNKGLLDMFKSDKPEATEQLPEATEQEAAK